MNLVARIVNESILFWLFIFLYKGLIAKIIKMSFFFSCEGCYTELQLYTGKTLVLKFNISNMCRSSFLTSVSMFL